MGNPSQVAGGSVVLGYKEGALESGESKVTTFVLKAFWSPDVHFLVVEQGVCVLFRVVGGF